MWLYLVLDGSLSRILFTCDATHCGHAFVHGRITRYHCLKKLLEMNHILVSKFMYYDYILLSLIHSSGIFSSSIKDLLFLYLNFWLIASFRSLAINLIDLAVSWGCFLRDWALQFYFQSIWSSWQQWLCLNFGKKCVQIVLIWTISRLIILCFTLWYNSVGIE